MKQSKQQIQKEQNRQQQDSIYSNASEEGHRRKFLYEKFFQEINKDLIIVMKDYLRNNKPNFPILQLQKSKNQPLISDFSKKSPITAFTLYEDIFIILECKKYQTEISKTTFFTDLSVKIGRNEKYLVERVKKKYPKMKIEDLFDAIKKGQPLRFGSAKQFLKPNIIQIKKQIQEIQTQSNLKQESTLKRQNNQSKEILFEKNQLLKVKQKMKIVNVININIQNQKYSTKAQLLSLKVKCLQNGYNQTIFIKLNNSFIVYNQNAFNKNVI